MSVSNPGVLYDATNSWNGYNHQGKIALWYAISEITRLYDTALTTDQNKDNLEKYFLEIEYMEDFSIGKKDGANSCYISVHQVKNRQDTCINEYESALLGLLSHLADDPYIEQAILHTTSIVNLGDKPLKEHLREFVTTPQYLQKIEAEITDNRTTSTFRNQLVETRRGRPSALKSNLQKVLHIQYHGARQLTQSNLDEALDLYLATIRNEKMKFSLLSDEQLDKVKICTYTIGGSATDCCPVDSALDLLKKCIETFYQKILSPGHYKAQNPFVDKSVLWMLGKLDEHIIERDLNFEQYKKGVLDRRIYFSDIFGWLMSERIDEQGTWFYLHHIKEQLFNKFEIYCKRCREFNKCNNCNVVKCKNKLGSLRLDEFEKFIHVTNPTVKGDLSQGTYSDYLQRAGIYAFTRGLHDIPKPFEIGQIPVSYKDRNNDLCALTTIAVEGTYDDIALISSDILRNTNVYDLLMDYGCLISKDVNIPSIIDEEMLQTPRYDKLQSEHIAHCKDVKIIPLSDFISSL